MRWPLLLFVICAGFFWKLTLSDEYTWLDSPDAAYQVLPWLQYQASEWHHGRFPLWDPYSWGGQPLIGQMQPGVAYPPNWLLFLSPLKDGFLQRSWLHWYYVLIHFQAALFCYWLCRDLKRSHFASLLAGVAFGLGGFMGTTDWPQILNGAVWAPLILMFFLRALRGERPVASAAWSGACLGIAFLSGHHQVPIFLGLMMAGAWIYACATDRRNIKLLLVFGVFVILVAAFQTIPAYEYGRLSVRWAGAANPVTWKDTVPYFVHQRLSIFPASLLGIVIPGLGRNSDPYIGLTALTLALLGLAAGWKDRAVRIVGAIAIGGLLFSLASVFQGVLYAIVPLVEKARNPSMAIVIFHFGLAVLIAYGVDYFHGFNPSILIAISGALFALQIGLQTAKMTFDDRISITALAGLLLALALATRSRAPLLLILLFELGNTTTWSFRSQVEVKGLTKQMSEQVDIAAFVRGQQVEVEEKDVPYNFGDWFGIEHFGGYFPSLTQNLARIQGNPDARRMYGIRYRVAREGKPDQPLVFSGASGVNVYKVADPFPRAWIESEQCGTKGSVTQVARYGGTVILDATLPCRGTVIDAGTYFPGWVASIDGKRARVVEAYGFLRGVVVEAGTHRVELHYRPKSVYIGAALTAIGLIGAALLRWRS